MKFEFNSIGYVESCFREKFGIPRQPGLVPAARASIIIQAPYHQREAFDGLQEFSHLWVSFVFHHNLAQGWQPGVRPPRLGGNEKTGVFATRSPFRPNAIGLSVVELRDIKFHKDQTSLHIGSADLVDGTPVLDIKPYVPYTDSIPDARAGFAQEIPQATKKVFFSLAAEQSCEDLQRQLDTPVRELIEQVLQLDPRPAYKGDEDPKLYGLRLYHFDVKWRVSTRGIEVENIEVEE